MIAVFVALAVGIIIGSGLVAGPSVQKQNTFIQKQISQIKSKITTLTQELKAKEDTIRALQSELARNEDLTQSLMSLAISGKLQGKTVSIIQTGDYKDPLIQIQNVLRIAGASTGSITTVRPDIWKTISASPEKDASSVAGEIAKAISIAVASAGGKQSLKPLEKKGYISTSGKYDTYCKLVVIVGGLKSESPERDLLDIAIVNSLRVQGVSAVGCEPSFAKVSTIPNFQRERISTVDNIDRSAGQISLVCALAGEKGDYGIRPTASRYMPKSIEAYRNK